MHLCNTCSPATTLCVSSTLSLDPGPFGLPHSKTYGRREGEGSGVPPQGSGKSASIPAIALASLQAVRAPSPSASLSGVSGLPLTTTSLAGSVFCVPDTDCTAIRQGGPFFQGPDLGQVQGSWVQASGGRSSLHPWGCWPSPTQAVSTSVAWWTSTAGAPGRPQADTG